jgi:hypothetical protein
MDVINQQDIYNSQKIDIIETLNEFVSTFTNMGLSREQIQVKLQIIKTIVANDLEEEDIEEFFGDAAVQIPDILYNLYEELFDLVEECPSNGLAIVQNFTLPVQTN